MSKKVLKVIFPKKCNGCELCVLEVQRQLGKAGLEGSPIRIFRDESGLSIDVDPRINTLNLEKIQNSCPLANFSIEETEDTEDYELLG